MRLTEKEKYRQRIENDRTNVQTKVQQISEKSPPEIEKDIEIEKEIHSSAKALQQNASVLKNLLYLKLKNTALKEITM